jgi:translocator protein
VRVLIDTLAHKINFSCIRIDGSHAAISPKLVFLLASLNSLTNLVPPVKRSYPLLAVFLVIVFAAAAVGWFYPPGDWYADLWKPSWTPPNWLFGPVWTVLYVLIAIAGWMIFSQPDPASAKYLWISQLILNALWSWLFFGLHNTWLALLDIVALVACIAVLVIVSYQRQRVASWLLLPYLIWVAYASTLNAAITFGNP